MQKIKRSKKSSCLACLVFLYLLTGCKALGLPTLTNLSYPNRSEISENQKKINQYLNEFVDFEFIHFNNPNPENWKREDIIKKLGNPINVETKEQENIHDPSQTDAMERLFYNHIEIGIYKIKGSDDQIMVTDMLIKGAGITLKGDIKVGDSPAKVTALLGKPTEQKKEDENQIDTYCDSFTGQTCLSFYSYFALKNKSDNKIHKITYQAYFD
ncbi:MAG: hypothetical protein AB7I41_20740 [Candidatus Sericytochromatia bacterium]